LSPWPTVYDYFRQWERTERITRIHAHLRDHIRLLEGRKRQPTVGILDSQSVKGSETCGPCGYDAGKKINGRGSCRQCGSGMAQTLSKERPLSWRIIWQPKL
jgi:hypothetical protein